MPINTELIDEYNEVHIAKDELSRGGQGIIYRTKDSDIAVKLVLENDKEIEDKDKIETYSKKFRNIRLLPLPNALQITLPMAVLENKAGYVMELLSDMKPIANLLSYEESNDIKIPEYLKGANKEMAQKFAYYSKTGGTKRRYLLLSKIASILSRLHSNGFIYGDISPSNIFISDEYSVYFIDADNICLEKKETELIYTPEYGAPELLKNKTGISTQSDVWAFAVLAFKTLSMNSPFKEIEQQNDDWADDNSNTDKSTDKVYDENLCQNGVGGVPIFTDDLQFLFKKTFENTENKNNRPSIFNYAIELAASADIMIICPDCKMSYFYDYVEYDNGKHQCPYCKAKRPDIIIFESYFNEGEKLAWKYVESANNEHFFLPERVVGEFLMTTFAENCVEVSVKNGIIEMRKNQDKIPLSITTGKRKNPRPLYGTIEADLNDNLCIFADSKNPRYVKIKIEREM